MTSIDRPAAIRAATRALVAENGFHGTSMSEIARRAGVATGTAYVHYASKDRLLIDAYLELKRELGAAGIDAVDPASPPAERFAQLWHAVRAFLEDDPDRAAFLVQFDASPYAAEGHRLALEVLDDPLVLEAGRPDLTELLVDLPPLVLYDLALGPLVRAVALGTTLDDATALRLRAASWRAIT